MAEFRHFCYPTDSHFISTEKNIEHYYKIKKTRNAAALFSKNRSAERVADSFKFGFFL